jgi:hypothetical protein
MGETCLSQEEDGETMKQGKQMFREKGGKEQSKYKTRKGEKSKNDASQSRPFGILRTRCSKLLCIWIRIANSRKKSSEGHIETK